MTIKVTFIHSDNAMTQFPFIVEFSHIKQNFTKNAAVELQKKLRLALDEAEEWEAANKVRSKRSD